MCVHKEKSFFKYLLATKLKFCKQTNGYECKVRLQERKSINLILRQNRPLRNVLSRKNQFLYILSSHVDNLLYYVGEAANLVFPEV